MIDLLRARRSVRQYTTAPVEKEKLDIMKEAVLRSPTSRNFKPCIFYFVQDHAILQKLSFAKPHGAAFLARAPLGVVICADQQKSDVWVEDASIASILLQMTAQSLGLGSCWIQIRKRMYDERISSEEYIKELLKLDENTRVESVIAIGYPDEKKEGIPFESLDDEKIIPK